MQEWPHKTLFFNFLWEMRMHRWMHHNYIFYFILFFLMRIHRRMFKTSIFLFSFLIECMYEYIKNLYFLMNENV